MKCVFQEMERERKKKKYSFVECKGKRFKRTFFGKRKKKKKKKERNRDN